MGIGEEAVEDPVVCQEWAVGGCGAGSEGAGVDAGDGLVGEGAGEGLGDVVDCWHCGKVEGWRARDD